MYQCLERAHQQLPHAISTTFDDEDATCDIVCFYFGAALLSLLQDDELMTAGNVVINPDNPTSMYFPVDGKAGEANSGQQWCMARLELCP